MSSQSTQARSCHARGTLALVVFPAVALAGCFRMFGDLPSAVGDGAAVDAEDAGPIDGGGDAAGSDVAKDPDADGPGGDADADERCEDGWADCNDSPADGCEARLDTALHCGDCDTACSGERPICDGESGRCVADPCLAEHEGEHDEDGDGVVDACDNCPSRPNSDQLDHGELEAGRDADGVGDACDPRPSGEGDSIAFFDSFSRAALGSDWATEGGDWQVADDALHQSVDDFDQRLFYSGVPLDPAYVVETRVTFDALANPEYSNAGVLLRASRRSDDGYVMGPKLYEDGGRLRIAHMDEGSATALAEVPLDPAPEAGDSYVVSGWASGSDLRAWLPSGEEVAHSDSVHPDGRVGLRTNYAPSTFDYFIVYNLGGS